MIITLQYPATCRDCGTPLQPGDRARYYGKGRVYGTECHDRDGVRTPRGEQRSLGSAEERGPERPQEAQTGLRRSEGTQEGAKAPQGPNLEALAMNLEQAGQAKGR